MGEVGSNGKLVVSDGAMGIGDGQGEGSLEESPPPMALYSCNSAMGMAADLAAALQVCFIVFSSETGESSGWVTINLISLPPLTMPDV